MARLLSMLAGVAALIALTTGLASAERSQKGNLVVSLQGGVKPLRLPRHRLAPVSVELSGSLWTTDGSTLPRVTRLELALSGHGTIVTQGLPVCEISRIIDRRTNEAFAACRSSLVGHGTLEARINLPDQASLKIHANLLIFNGRTPAGRTELLVHGYAPTPPTVVVVPFVLQGPPGSFHNVLTATLPRHLGPWPRVAAFKLDLSRRFAYRGARRSFLVASCPVPHPFTAGFLGFARATYTLAGGSAISTEIVRSCNIR